MRIDLPACNFQNCRYCFDNNCTKKTAYQRCAYRFTKAEAIKEFWDRLQKDFPNLFAGQHPCTLSEIDFLVKELAEEQNGNL